ncbi:MAG: hypothetical protein D6705_16445 [Deltaproteobacteria bacterium]|nr:MAG: hypothetical protein D6705_16445 [Deltaproteobacteria bacterium]
MGGGGNGDVEFSYIWIANSAEGTVSKIDTKTGVEVGRYYTDPSMGGGSPSRTSVNLLGDVAVSNRWPASTTKIAARPERCVDLNNNGMIDTSTGPADVRPWGQDECVLWNTPFPAAADYQHGARPTQWEGGETDQNGCADPNPRLWVAFEDGAGNAHIVRLDGETGAILDEVTTPWGAAGIGSGYGPYGGVVNAEGDLYVSGLGGSGRLVHVDAETLAITDLGNPGTSFYGIGIDQDGNPWIAGGGSVAVWDATAMAWTTIATPNGSLRGIQVDRDGRAWAAGNSPCGLVSFDVATRTVANGQIDLPGCAVPVGISIDPEGYVWSPDMTANLAFKVDPNTLTVTFSVTGLNQPYTYSDMTGAGLGLVTNPPAG